MQSSKFKTQDAKLVKTLSLIFLFLILHFAFHDAHAEKTHDEYKQIQKDIRTHKRKLESVKRVEKNVLDDLRKTTAELSEIDRQLSHQRKKIKELQANISALREEIKSDSAALQAQKGILKKRLRTLLVFNMEKDAFLILLSGDDVSQAMRIVKYLREISEHDYRLIKKYKEELRILAEKETGLRKLMGELKGEEKKTVRLEGELKEKKRERESLLIKVRKEKSIYENMIKELKEASARLLKIIQESERRERDLKKRRSAKRGAKEEQFEDSEFLRLKGKLDWPVSGTVAIQYGTQVDPLFNLPVFRSGIHIKADNGTTVKAVSEGKVVYADEFKGYGNLVIVSHGSGYHTLYGNLERIFSKNGAIIRDGQAIGEVGESATLGTSGLYFEIRYKGKPLDPQQWLTRR